MRKTIRRTLSQAALVAAALLFSVGIQSLAVGTFTAPTATPPGGNVAAPLNVSATSQTKIGGLLLNVGGALNGLIVAKGNVGIGTTNPTSKLDVNGDVNIGTGKSYSIGGNKILSSNGHNIVAGPGNTASGFGSSAVGSGNTASIINSSAVGSGNTASGIGSSAFGYGTTASGFGSSAFGSDIKNNIQNSTMIGSSNSAKITIRSSGNVGIGTTNPTTKLDVNGSGSFHNTLNLTGGGDTTYKINSQEAMGRYSGWDANMLYLDGYGGFTSGVSVGSPGARTTKFQVYGGTSYFGGNVGIGTTNPTSKLDVNGNVAIRGSRLYIGGGSAHKNYFYGDTTNTAVRQSGAFDVQNLAGRGGVLNTGSINTGSINVTKICLNGVCRTSWPTSSTYTPPPTPTPVTHTKSFYTAGSYSWVVPAGVTSVTIDMSGGGGSGGGAVGYYDGGGGGGAGGAYKGRIYSVSPGQTIAVRVGAGGVDGYNNGGASSFGSLIATGGSNGGAAGYYDGGGGGVGGHGGTGTGGFVGTGSIGVSGGIATTVATYYIGGNGGFGGNTAFGNGGGGGGVGSKSETNSGLIIISLTNGFSGVMGGGGGGGGGGGWPGAVGSYFGSRVPSYSGGILQNGSGGAGGSGFVTISY